MCDERRQAEAVEPRPCASIEVLRICLILDVDTGERPGCEAVEQQNR
jgi:hypothetical protein